MATVEDILSAGMEAPDEFEIIDGLLEDAEVVSKLEKISSGLEDGLVDKNTVAYINDLLQEEEQLGLEAFTTVPTSAGISDAKAALSNAISRRYDSIRERMDYISKLISEVEGCGCGTEYVRKFSQPNPVKVITCGEITAKPGNELTPTDIHNTVLALSKALRKSEEAVIEGEFTAIGQNLTKAMMGIYHQYHHECGCDTVNPDSALPTAVRCLKEHFKYLLDDSVVYITPEDAKEFWDSAHKSMAMEDCDDITVRDVTIVKGLARFKPSIGATIPKNVIEDFSSRPTDPTGFREWIKGELSRARRVATFYLQVRKDLGM